MYYAFNEANNSNIDALFSMALGVTNVATGGALAASKDVDNYSYSSIAKASSKLIAVFPILTSRTVSAETAQAVSKFIEQNACQFFMLALQQANISNAKSGIEYIQRYHQNLNVGGQGSDALIKAMQTWVDAFENGRHIAESSIISNIINNTPSDKYYDDLLESDNIEYTAKDIKEIMEAMASLENIKVYDTKLNPLSINDFTVREFADGNYHVSIRNYEPLKEANGSSGGLRKEYRDQIKPGNPNGKYDNRAAALQAQRDDDADVNYSDDIRKRNRQRIKDQRDDIAYNQDRSYTMYQRNRQLAKDQRDDVEHREDRMHTIYQRNRQYDKDRRDDAEHNEDRAHTIYQRNRQYEKDRREDEDRARQDRERRDEAIARSQSGSNVSVLKDQDIKKMNDGVPSLLTVKFYQSKDASVATTFIIGVKAKMIPVTTSEILRRIMNDNKDGKKFIKFMRFMTGELKASDFILGLSRIKEDIKSCKVKGAYGNIWNMLKNRAEAAREQVKHGQRNDFSAITTVLISQADVEELYREENFDISDPKNALHFMKSYNLMGFAIADDSTESLKILFDNDTNTFDEYSYTMLEREQKDGTYKKLINLMAASK